MVKNLYYDYSALAILVLMLITCAVKKSSRGRTNRSFLFLVFAITYSVLYDICAVLLDNHGMGAVFFKYLMHIGYLLIRNFIPVAYVTYVIMLTDTSHFIKKNVFVHIASCIPYAVVFVLTITTPLTQLMFYLDEKTRYTRGPLFFLYYLCAFFYMMYGLIYATKNIRLLTVSKYIPLITIIPFQAVSIVVQFLKPDMLVEMIFSALAILFIMLTIQRPESMYDQITTLFKMSVFTENVRLACQNKKNIKIVLITITNYQTLSSYINYEKISMLNHSFGRKLVTAVSMMDLDSAEIYYLGHGRYSIILGSEDYNKLDDFLKLLKIKISEYIVAEDLQFTLPTNICVVSIPDDFSVYEEFLAFAKDNNKLKYSNDIIYAKDMVKNVDYTVIANMDSILSDAIKNKEFEVYYQPIYSIKEDRFNSAEALIRLKTEKYGNIRPDLFIPLAEESGLINDIDDIVFEEVCKFIASDDFKRLNVDYIEVNLSVIQCMQPDLADKILATMKQYGISPSQINLEVTETATEYSQAAIEANIEKLHEAGISFSLDDYGTGYSNIVRISSLPLHIVKLDKTFTFTDGNSELEKILVNTVDMIKKMDLKIVVEGIETEKMLKQFADLECDYIQGYYFSRPIPKDEFVKFISARQ